MYPSWFEMACFMVMAFVTTLGQKILTWLGQFSSIVSEGI